MKDKEKRGSRMGSVRRLIFNERDMEEHPMKIRRRGRKMRTVGRIKAC